MVRWARIELQISIEDDVWKNPRGLVIKTSLIHARIKSPSIHPFSLAFTTTQSGKLPLGNVFLLKIAVGGNFNPLEEHAKTTVHDVFSYPVVIIGTELAPTCSTVRLAGISKGILTMQYFVHIDNTIEIYIFLGNFHWTKLTECSGFFLNVSRKALA